jgi:hypothetical protein
LKDKQKEEEVDHLRAKNQGKVERAGRAQWACMEMRRVPLRCGTQTMGISIPWESVGNANLRASTPDLLNHSPWN